MTVFGRLLSVVFGEIAFLSCIKSTSIKVYLKFLIIPLALFITSQTKQIRTLETLSKKKPDTNYKVDLKMDKLIVGQLNPAMLSYKWEIQNFCTGCKKPGEYILSPKFSSMDHNKELKWCLRLYPKGRKEKDKNYVSLYLAKCADESKTGCFVESVTLSLLNDANVKVHEFILLKKEFTTDSWGCTRFINRNDIMNARKGLLKNDTLTILCEIIFDPTVVTTQNDNDSSDEDKVLLVAKTYEANYKQELRDFEGLLENKTFSDVTFTVGDQKIGAHKAILASRSPVFQAIFKINVKENKDNVIDIKDIKYEVMKELLRFIYASTVHDINSLASDLLIAAEKYSISGLKILCEKVLHDSLTVDNAVEYLNLSCACNTVELKSQVIEFIVSNRKDMVNRPEFKTLPSDIMCQVVQAIVEDESM